MPFPTKCVSSIAGAVVVSECASADILCVPPPSVKPQVFQASLGSVEQGSCHTLYPNPHEGILHPRPRFELPRPCPYGTMDGRSGHLSLFPMVSYSWALVASSCILCQTHAPWQCTRAMIGKFQMPTGLARKSASSSKPLDHRCFSVQQRRPRCADNRFGKKSAVRPSHKG